MQRSMGLWLAPPVQRDLCLAIMGTETGQQAAGEAFRTLRGAYEEAVAAIEAMSDGREAFSQAGELARVLGEWSKQAAKLRATVAVRIAKDEELSLAGLANRLSLSRARAQQLMESGRAGKGGPGDG